jgi:hypothetical protein
VTTGSCVSLNFLCGLPAPACWAITAFAINDMATTAPTIALVVFVFIVPYFISSAESVGIPD